MTNKYDLLGMWAKKAKGIRRLSWGEADYTWNPDEVEKKASLQGAASAGKMEGARDSTWSYLC